MSLSPVLAFLQDAPAAVTGSAVGIVRIVFGVMALVMVARIIFRRKGTAKEKGRRILIRQSLIRQFRDAIQNAML